MPAKPSKSFKRIGKLVYKRQHAPPEGVTYREVGKKRFDALMKSPNSEVIGRGEGGYTIMHKGRMYMWSSDDKKAYEVIEESTLGCSETVELLESVREQLEERRLQPSKWKVSTEDGSIYLTLDGKKHLLRNKGTAIAMGNDLLLHAKLMKDS